MHDPYDLFCERDALDTELERREPQHTPLPWSAVINTHGDRVVTAPVPACEFDSYLVAHIPKGDRAEANAALIVEAVNAHEGLVAERDRLRRAIETIAETLDWLPDSEQPFFVIGAALTELAEKARAALALVEEEA